MTVQEFYDYCKEHELCDCEIKPVVAHTYMMSMCPMKTKKIISFY